MPAGRETGPDIRLSVVLPVYAETESVRQIVEALERLVGPRLHEVLIVISRDSPAESFAVSEGLARRTPQVEVMEQRDYPGLGFAIRQGIEAAGGSHILLMDSDGEMDVETVPQMLVALERDDLDLVIGSRWAEGGGVEGYDSFKYYLNMVYQYLFRWLYRTHVRDLTLGFKLGRAEVLQGFDWSGQYHEIGCETTLRPIRAGYRVGEVPTVWRQRRQGRSSNPLWRNLRYVWMALAILLVPGRHQAMSEVL